MHENNPYSYNSCIDCYSTFTQNLKVSSQVNNKNKMQLFIKYDRKISAIADITHSCS